LHPPPEAADIPVVVLQAMQFVNNSPLHEAQSGWQGTQASVDEL
jgi:hypothetical protein